MFGFRLYRGFEVADLKASLTMERPGSEGAFHPRQENKPNRASLADVWGVLNSSRCMQFLAVDTADISWTWG